MLNLNNWRYIGTNETILKWLSEGVKFEFLRNPLPFYRPNKHFTSSASTFLREEIQRLLKNNYIVPSDSEYISPLSCVAKRNGGFRLIINLRHLNEHVEKLSHKVEDIKCVASIIKPNDLFTSIDLRDSFYHFKIHKDYQKYLSFKFEGQCYSYCVLPFGFSLSPYFHTKMLRPVVSYLRSLKCKNQSLCR